MGMDFGRAGWQKMPARRSGGKILPLGLGNVCALAWLGPKWPPGDGRGVLLPEGLDQASRLERRPGTIRREPPGSPEEVVDPA